MHLFQNVCESCSAMITRAYSTSFSLGILALAPEMRVAIRNIYGFVRFADEIVDTFHSYDKKSLLKRFKEDTYRAIEEGVSFNPVMHAFQRTVRQYRIEIKLIDAFLHSMEMDLNYKNYQDEGFQEYVYGSAEVVGLMCLKVFCEGDQSKYDELKDSARALGAAFQKINFLRDLKSDYQDRGRLYFPQVKFFEHFDLQVKKQIEMDIEKDFEKALNGIRKLPSDSRFGVYIAYIYFYRLLQKIHKMEPKKVMQERIRVSNPEKIALFFSSWFKFRMNLL
ncbi:MAG: phytoene/squalene synthase family protein [Bacteroidetes bacterium]|nr:phytoene/squalene synthase family protein [Bacteroidota bacterium]